MSQTKTQNNGDIAVAYYQAMNNKNLEEMGKLLHPDIELISPMNRIKGKDKVLAAAKNLFEPVKSIAIHTKLFGTDHAVLTYDMQFDEPIGNCRTAAVMTFRQGLIARNELFFDASPFHEK